MHYGDALIVTVFRNGAERANFVIANSDGSLVDFFGVLDPDGIDAISIHAQANQNGFPGIDDFRFGGAVNAAPEPTSLFLLGSGLAAAVMARRRGSPVTAPRARDV